MGTNYSSLDEDEMHKMIVATATKLIGTDLVNDDQESRYKDQDKQGYQTINYALAAEDAALLIVASLVKAKEFFPEIEKIQELDTEEEEEEPATEGEGIQVEANPCESQVPSSRTSASSKRSKRVSTPE